MRKKDIVSGKITAAFCGGGGAESGQPWATCFPRAGAGCAHLACSERQEGAGKGEVPVSEGAEPFWAAHRAASEESVPCPDFATWAWGARRERWGPGGPKAAMGSRQVQSQVGQATVLPSSPPPAPNSQPNPSCFVARLTAAGLGLLR